MPAATRGARRLSARRQPRAKIVRAFGKSTLGRSAARSAPSDAMPQCAHVPGTPTMAARTNWGHNGRKVSLHGAHRSFCLISLLLLLFRAAFHAGLLCRLCVEAMAARAPKPIFSAHGGSASNVKSRLRRNGTDRYPACKFRSEGNFCRGASGMHEPAKCPRKFGPHRTKAKQNEQTSLCSPCLGARV